jgi:hypothetical protein
MIYNPARMPNKLEALGGREPAADILSEVKDLYRE